MTPSSSPTVRRRRLAAELKRLRLGSKLTIDQVAEALEWSPGKVSKIENSRVSVLPRDARRLLELYGLSEGPERDQLLALSRESRERGWWQQYGEAVPEWFATYVGLEAEASSISNYQAEYVPGLLQTADYATAVHRAALMNASEEDIARQVAVRMERQERLTSADAPQLWAVLNEAVIRRIVGERAVMHEQLVKLVDASRAPNISLQILPFSAGAHPSMDSAFSIVSFDAPIGGDIVYFEHPTCSLYLEQADEVARYKLIYENLRAAALPLTESQRLLARTAEGLAEQVEERCGMEADLSHAVWRKSSFSNGSGGACVETARLDDGGRAIRDTKDRGEGPVLIFTVAEWEAFLKGVRAGEFD